MIGARGTSDIDGLWREGRSTFCIATVESRVDPALAHACAESGRLNQYERAV